jgi:hypothetical protein
MLIALVACIAAAVMAVIVAEEIQRHRRAVNAMPKITEKFAYEIDEMLRTRHDLVALMGTGSMSPPIPVGKPTERVAYIAVDNSRDFDTLGEGAPVVFRHDSGQLIFHSLAKLTPSGWVTSGLANSHYDTGYVTRKNLRGVAVEIFVIKKK